MGSTGRSFSKKIVKGPFVADPSTATVTGTGTANYMAMFTGATAIGNSSIYQDASLNIGLGLTTLGAKLHVKGIGSTSATYSLKVDSATVSNLFAVRDDGSVGIGVTPVAGRSLNVLSNNGIGAWFQNSGTSGTQYAIVGSTTGINTGTNIAGYFEALNGATNIAIQANSGDVYVVSGKVGIGAQNASYKLYVTTTTGVACARFDSSFTSGTGYASVHSSTGTNAGGTNVGIYVEAINGGSNYAIQVPSNGGSIGFGILAPTARLHIVGTGSTSSTYGLKVDSATVADLFTVRDDGSLVVGATTATRKFTLLQDTASISFGSMAVATSLAAMYYNQTAPSATNYAIGGDATRTLVNATTSVESRIGNVAQMIIKSGVINMPLLPTSTVGLVAGDLWNDVGQVKIV